MARQERFSLWQVYREVADALKQAISQGAYLFSYLFENVQTCYPTFCTTPRQRKRQSIQALYYRTYFSGFP
jgi:hypothetical protein